MGVDKSPLESVAVPRGLAVVVGYPDGSVRIWKGDGRERVKAASVTKAMVALVAVMLAERRVIELDAPISARLGDAPQWAAKTTWIELLTHCGGTPFEWDADLWREERHLGDQDLMAAFLVSSGLPGAGDWHYSNAGYQLLGLAIGQACSQPWPEIAEALVWKPAGMEHTGIDQSYPVDSAAAAAAGGVESTLEDLCRLGAVLAGLRPDILDEAALRMMTRPQAVVDRETLQALGVHIALGERSRVLSWGTLHASTVLLSVEPGSHVVALACDEFSEGAALRKLADETHRDLWYEPHVTQSPESWWLDGHEVLVTVVGNHVVACRPNEPVYLFRAPIADVLVGAERIEYGGLCLHRRVEDSPW